MRTKTTFFLLFLLSSLQWGMAQESTQSDSIQQMLDGLSPDEKLDRLWFLARESAFTDSLQTLEYLKHMEGLSIQSDELEGIKLALKANLYEASGQHEQAAVLYEQAANQLIEVGDKGRSGQTRMDLAVMYGRAGDFPSMKQNVTQSLVLFEAIQDTLLLIAGHSNLGRVHQLEGQLDSAMLSLFRAVELAEAYEPSDWMRATHLRLSGNAYNNLGIAYMENGELDQAHEMYLHAIEQKKALGDPIEVGNMFINMGGISFEKGDLKEARSLLDSAVEYYSQADYLGGLFMCRTNAAAVSNVVGEYEKAIDYGLEASALAKKTSDKTNEALNYIHLATSYRHLAKRDLSKLYIDSAIHLGRSINSKKVITEVQNLQYEWALDDKDFEEALAYRNSYYATKDSMYQVDKSKEIAELETRYKTAEKEKEIQLLDQEIALKEASLERNIFLIGGLVVFIFLLILSFLFVRAQSKQRHQAVLQEQKIRMREAQMQAVIDSQERERKRFATDLHDGLGQLISALQLNIRSMNHLNGDKDQRDELYHNSTELLGEVHIEIRNIAFNLMPQTLMQEGLVAALEELIHRINKAGGMQVHLSITDVNERFNELAEVSLYRIVQELLSNVMKYSAASEVYLSLILHDDELILSLEDNGKGYDLEQFKKSQGNGWRNINTRLNLIHGEINIDTQVGRVGNQTMIQIGVEQLSQSVEERPTA